MSCVKFNGKDSILFEDLESTFGEQEAKAIYSIIRTQKFKREFGDWERYNQLTQMDELSDDEKEELARFENTMMGQKLDENGEPLMRYVLDYGESSPRDIAENIIRNREFKNTSVSGFTGVTKFIQNVIAQRLDMDLYEFNAEEYISTETMNRLNAENVSPANKNARAKEIEDELRKDVENWEKLAELGEELHNLNEDIAKDERITDYSSFKTYASFKIPNINESLLENYVNRFTTYLNRLRERGSILTEQDLFYNKKDHPKVKGRSDLLLLRHDGKVEIIDYKFAVKGYSDWNNQKIRTMQYQLSVYRNILKSYGLEVEAMTAVPFELSGDISTKAEGIDYISLGTPIDVNVTYNLGRGNVITDTVDSLLPVDYFDKDINFESNASVKAMMKKLFNIDLSAEVFSLTFEDFKKRMYYVKKNKEGEVYHYVFDPYRVMGKSKRKYIPLDKDLLESHKSELLDKKLRSYYNTYINQAGSINKQLKQYFENLKRARDGEFDEPFFGSSASRTGTGNMSKAMAEYVKQDWSIVDIPELEELGIVAFKKEMEGQTLLDLVIMSDGKFDNVHDLGFGKNRSLITGAYKPDREIIQSMGLVNMPKATKGNMAAMKGVLWVLNNSAQFDRDLKFGKIKIASTKETPKVADFNALKKGLSVMKEELEPHMRPATDKDFGSSDMLNYLNYLIELSTSPEYNSNLQFLFSTKAEKLRKSYYERDIQADGRDNLLALLREEQKRMIKQRKANVSYYDDTRYKMLSAAITELEQINIGTIRDIQKTGTVIGVNAEFSAPQEFQNEGMQRIVKEASDAIYNSTYAYRNMLEETRPKFEEFFEGRSYNVADRNILGNSTKLYSDLIDITNNNGEHIMRIKPLSELTGPNKQFAEFFLETINKKKMSKMSEVEIKNFKDSPEYRNIPLLPSTMYGKFQNQSPLEAIKSVFTNLFDVENMIKNDPSYQQDLAEKTTMGDLFGFYDRPENRWRQLEDNKPGQFETNLQMVLYSYMLNDIKVREFNKKLHLIDAIKSTMLLKSEQFGIPIENMEEWIESYLETAVFNKPELNNESIDAERLDRGLMVMTRIATYGAIGFNPFTGATQFFQGAYGNAIEAIANSIVKSDLPGVSDMVQAYAVVMGDEAMSIGNIGLMESLNETYRMSNMDLQFIVERTRERRGVMNFGSKWLFWMNNAPEYYHRVSFFVGKMIKDGTYKAHTNVKGKLVYDQSKDPRFEHYLADRKNHEDYEQQKALFEFMVRELSNETDGVVYKDGKPILKRAYTISQARTLNHNSDRVHGAYSHEDKIKFAKTAFGRMMMQFKTWLRSKVNRYTQEPNVNPAHNGKVVYKRDEDGNLYAIWEGRQMEGILYTLKFLYHEATEAGGLIEGIKATMTAGEKLTEEQKKNLVRMSLDIILVGGMMAFFAAMKEELEKDRGSFKSAVIRSMYYASMDFNVLTTFGVAFDKDNPVVSIGFFRDSLESIFKVATLQQEPMYLLRAFGATKFIYYQAMQAEATGQSRGNYIEVETPSE